MWAPLKGELLAGFSLRVAMFRSVHKVSVNLFACILNLISSCAYGDWH